MEIVYLLFVAVAHTDDFHMHYCYAVQANRTKLILTESVYLARYFGHRSRCAIIIDAAAAVRQQYKIKTSNVHFIIRIY